MQLTLGFFLKFGDGIDVRIERIPRTVRTMVFSQIQKFMEPGTMSRRSTIGSRSKFM